MKKPPVVTDDICFCPLSGILDVIAKKWALLIITIHGNEGEEGFTGRGVVEKAAEVLVNPRRVLSVRMQIGPGWSPTRVYVASGY